MNAEQKFSAAMIVLMHRNCSQESPLDKGRVWDDSFLFFNQAGILASEIRFGHFLPIYIGSTYNANGAIS